MYSASISDGSGGGGEGPGRLVWFYSAAAEQRGDRVTECPDTQGPQRDLAHPLSAFHSDPLHSSPIVSLYVPVFVPDTSLHQLKIPAHRQTFVSCLTELHLYLITESAWECS